MPIEFSTGKEPCSNSSDFKSNDNAACKWLIRLKNHWKWCFRAKLFLWISQRYDRRNSLHDQTKSGQEEVSDQSWWIIISKTTTTANRQKKATVGITQSIDKCRKIYKQRQYLDQSIIIPKGELFPGNFCQRLRNRNVKKRCYKYFHAIQKNKRY